MTRLTRLSEDDLVNRLMAVRQGFDELKATVQTMGSTNITLQRVVTGNAADFHVSNTYNVIHGWQAVFTPNSIGIASTGMVWKSFWNGFNAVGTGGQNTFTELTSVVGNVWTYRFWTIGTSPSLTLDYDVRVVFYAMSQGTISISQIQ